MFFSPAMRDASSAVGGTTWGGAGGGGGGGGGGGPWTPFGSPLTTPPSTPPSTPFGSPWTSGAFSCFSIFTGWTMSFTVCFLTSNFVSCGFDAPLGGGGGGGGGGASARSCKSFGGSSRSICQIPPIHIQIRRPATNTPDPNRRGAANLGGLRCFAASKAANICPPGVTDGSWRGVVMGSSF